MPSRLLFVLLSCTWFITLAYTAAPPVNIALQQPSNPPETPQINTSNLQALSLLNDTVTFKIPRTQLTLIVSKFSKLVSQTELNICIVEFISSIFSIVLAKGRDGFLPLHSLESKYGNVVINVYDFSAPVFRMTYASVVSALRGIALFTSLYGYWSTTFEIYDRKMGHVGTGDFGPVIPN